MSDPTSLSKDLIEKSLSKNAKKYRINVYDLISSTNTVLRELAEQGAEENTVLIASEQTNGRGRMGRNFFSPSETGVYISVLLHPDLPAEKTVFITTAAAVAMCKAIEKTTDKKPKIKWVNDIFIDGKKACGILTEAVFENGKIKYAVLGVGINVFEPDGGFPEEIKNIAGAVSNDYKNGLRELIAAEFLNELALIDPEKTSKEYKKRSFVIGKKITVINAGTSYDAIAEDIDENCCLMIKKEDGEKTALSSGEISIRL